jgi:hypothetical protein
VASAIAYCRLLWNNVVGLIDEKIAIGKDAKELRRIRGMVGSGISRSDLLKLTKLKKDDFNRYLETLVVTGELVVQRRMPSEVGLERSTNRQLQWIVPARLSKEYLAQEQRLGDAARHLSVHRPGPESSNGSLPPEFTGSESEVSTGTERRTESEAKGSDPLSESPLNSPSLSPPSIHKT